MGAFLSGMLGAAGEDADKKEKRDYEEAKSERDRKRMIVQYAAETAIQKGQDAALPEIFGELDDLMSPSNAPKGMKDPFRQMGGKLAQIFKQRRQAQQQKQQQQQADQTYSQVNGVPPPGQQQAPQAGQGGPPASPAATPPFLPQGQQPTPAMPQSRVQQMVAAMAQARAKQQQQGIAEDERQFQTDRTRTGIKAGDVTEQQKKKADALTEYFKKGGMEEKAAREEADRIAFGKMAEPTKSNIKMIQNVKGDEYGHPGEIGTLEVDYSKPNEPPKFYSTTSKTSGGADELTKMTKIIMARTPGKPVEQATREAADALFKTKVLNPQERINLMRNTVRTIMGENALLEVPTHAGGPAPKAIQFPNTVQTPSMPGPSGPVQRAGSGRQPTPGAQPTEPWHPEVKGAERTRKTNAEVIMTQGGNAIATINSMSQKHPDWFGPAAGRIQDLEKRVGTSDPDVGRLKGAMESLIGFLPALHGFRSAGILKSWQDTLDNPLKNPQYTAQVMREVMKAAEETRNSIMGRNVGPMSAESSEQKATASGGAPKRKVWNDKTQSFEDR